MLTKAIVEEVLSPYQVKVRIPLLDSIASAPMSNSSNNLNIATICSLPNCYMNIQVGDVVFVGFEDNTYYKAVVLGHLSREAFSSSYADVTFGELTVNAGAYLPQQTSIGEVTSSEIARLQGLRENIQQQLDALSADIESIYEKLQEGNS